VQQIGGEEMRMLRALKREDGAALYVFMTDRGAQPAGFREFLTACVAAKFQFPVRPHMLRHACRYKLANACPAALLGAKEDHAHGEIYGTVTGVVQDFFWED
jgi:integrase